MKTGIARPFSLYKPVHSCKLIWKSSVAFLDHLCTCVFLKLPIGSGFTLFLWTVTPVLWHCTKLVGLVILDGCSLEQEPQKEASSTQFTGLSSPL